MKNIYAKTRPTENPYEIWQVGDWFYLLLKKWQIDDYKPCARWFCDVYTPMTGGSFDFATMKPTGSSDMGDCYASEVMRGVCIYRDPSLTPTTN